MTNKKKLSPSIENFHVDEEWYLQEYGDVAAAGINARDHYTTHGVNEGRFPKSLRARALEEKIWKGFSRYALAELKEIFACENSDPNERLYAATALARWHSSWNEWDISAIYADHITNSYPLPGFIKHEGAEIIASNIHVRNGNHDTALYIIEKIDLSITSQADQLLLIANLLTASATETSGPLALGPINKIFETVGLQPIRIGSPKKKLSFDSFLNFVDLHAVTMPQKISILMPAFNAAHHIEWALNGLLKQTWANIEIIVVDDASSDETSNIVAKLKSIDARIKLFRHDQQQGAYAARNTALKAAKGEFVINHDSDDWSHPERLELMIRPLLTKPAKKMSICSWVRVDSEFMFMKPCPDLRLIHPSISTAMIRLEMLKKLGGWDEVKVAADSEMMGRIIAVYGPAVIETVLPTIPLVISREILNSLTTAPQTHWRSDFFGLRNLYRQSYEEWHRLISEKQAEPLIISAIDQRRSFFCPASNSLSTQESNHYDLVIYADFGSSTECEGSIKYLVSELSRTAVRFALFHWPAYGRPNPDSINEEYLKLANEGTFDFLTPNQAVVTEELIIHSNGNLKFHLDSLPQVQFQKIISLTDKLQAREIINDSVSRATSLMGDKLRSSSLFDSDWYVSIYPDVRSFTSSPIDHFVNHGFYEGRQASPEICLNYYSERYLKPNNSSSPLLHYLNKGRFLGYSIKNPKLSGKPHKNLKKPTILACAHAADANIFGAERSFLDTLKALHSIGYNLVVTLPTYTNKSYIDSIANYSTSIYIVPYPLWTQSKLPNNWAIEKLENLIAEHSIDLVYSNTLILREPLLAAKNRSIPSIAHAHEVFEETDPICTLNNIMPQQIYATIRELSTAVIANSKFTASFLNSSSFQSTVIPNSIDTQEYQVNTEINSDTLKIGIISSNIEKKGISDFFRLAKILEDRLPTARFLVIGPTTQYLENLLKTAPANLNHIGYVSSSIEAIGMLDIVLNLSICQETFGRTILEGMAAGKTVVAYNRGALPELIDHGQTGYIVDYRNLDSLSNIITELYLDPFKIQKISEKARTRVKKLFSEDVIKKSLRATFKNILLR